MPSVMLVVFIFLMIIFLKNLRFEYNGKSNPALRNVPGLGVKYIGEGISKLTLLNYLYLKL